MLALKYSRFLTYFCNRTETRMKMLFNWRSWSSGLCSGQPVPRARAFSVSIDWTSNQNKELKKILLPVWFCACVQFYSMVSEHVLRVIAVTNIGSPIISCCGKKCEEAHHFSSSSEWANVQWCPLEHPPLAWFRHILDLNLLLLRDWRGKCTCEILDT